MITIEGLPQDTLLGPLIFNLCLKNNCCHINNNEQLNQQADKHLHQTKPRKQRRLSGIKNFYF